MPHKLLSLAREKVATEVSGITKRRYKRRLNANVFKPNIFLRE